jgi:hypothetical protein
MRPRHIRGSIEAVKSKWVPAQKRCRDDECGNRQELRNIFCFRHLGVTKPLLLQASFGFNLTLDTLAVRLIVLPAVQVRRTYTSRSEPVAGPMKYEDSDTPNENVRALPTKRAAEAALSD